MRKTKLPSPWILARKYLDEYLVLRNCSSKTIESYRTTLNHYIGYLESQKNISRFKVSFTDFKKENLNDYLKWMRKDLNLKPKTCNLRITGIRSFLEYAASEEISLMPFYIDSKSVISIQAEKNRIEFFENEQLEALLKAPNTDSATDRRNKMLLVLMYDTGARVSEITQMNLQSLHLRADPPYVTIHGKGNKYRNIPLMPSTAEHLKQYLEDFHSDNANSASKEDIPLFYSKIHGRKCFLSADTLEKLIKKYSQRCEMNGIKMPEHVHCHMIRKTRAMNLYSAGIPLPHIQQLLGHEDISTTSGFYAFITLNQLAKEIENTDFSSEEKKWKDPLIIEQLLKL